MGAEQAFSEFLETNATDKLFNDYSAAIRKAFIQGYKCAMKKKFTENNVIKLYDYSIQSNAPVKLRKD
jgi:hypothetical protein